jgi:GGDEF domain-containing protein
MQQGPPRIRRARPVADAPIDALLMRAEDLTKGWLLALLEQAPLDDAAAILAADLARDGPRVCSAVVRALADDADLRRLEPGGALEPLAAQTGEISGSRGADMTARAVDTLRAVIWSALRAELSQPDPDQVSELAERLNLVTERVREAALRRVQDQAPPVDAAVVPGEERPLRELTPRLHDARSDATPGPHPGATPDSRPEPDLEPHYTPDSLWKGALADEMRRAEHGGAALSLLLVELEDSDRVLAVEPPGEATATFGRFAQAVRSVARRQDILACETDTRAWIIARDTGRLGAHALAARIVAAVGSSAPWRGAPLSVTVGFAVLGEDGRDVEALLEAAEEARFAAASSGIGVIPVDEPSFTDPDQHPPGAGPELAG